MQPIRSLADIPPLAGYLARINAEPRGLRSAVVKEHHGNYWRDLAVITVFPETGDIKVTRGDNKLYAPTTDEIKAIKEALPNYRFPASRRVLHYKLPPELQSTSADNIFEFKDRDNSLIMLVVRSERKDTGDKVYRPWTLFDDDEWRCAEPDGKLPLWGLEHLDGNTTVFIHEGPKAARAVHRLIHPHTDEEHAALDAHPWRDELQAAAHLGWHGGALNPYRTDWSVLQRVGVKNVYIVGDNDPHGVKAVPRISEQLHGARVYEIRFNKKFPASFDMADPFPEKFWETKDGVRRYKGPRFDELLQPATWATDIVDPTKKSKPTFKLREEFAEQWYWCAKPDVYINVHRPTWCYPQTTFDAFVKPFCHGGKPSQLLQGHLPSHANQLTYRPDHEERTLDENGLFMFNSFLPSSIRAEAGNSQPWEDYLDYVFVKPNERHEVKRWLATLIAHPEIRMRYSLLLVSELQGVGKTTLGASILAPLVGTDNTSFTSEHEIVESQFNGWAARKRLIVIGEIYAGHSWRAYKKLKPYVAGDPIRVNEKFMQAYDLQNWTHFVCCSNSMQALKLEDDDRRWFFPELSETYWGGDKDIHKQNYIQFYAWLNSGGLNIIRHWAENFGDYVLTGDHAPMTESKKRSIEEGAPEAVKLLWDWCEASSNKKITVYDGGIKSFIDNAKLPPHYQTPVQLRRQMEKRGWVNPGFPLNIGGIIQRVLMSPALYRDWRNLNGATDQEKRDFVREGLKQPMISAEEKVI